MTEQELRINDSDQANAAKMVKTNITIRWGDRDGCFNFDFCLKKNLKNKIKIKILCFFFPYKLVRWDDEAK
jgi:hypothetical protein